MAYYHDWSAARSEIDSAIALDPNNAEPLLWRSWMGLTLGKRDSALADIRAAMSRDPLDPFISLFAVYIEANAGSPDSALVYNQRLKRIDPEFFYLEAWESGAYRRQGKLGQALAADSAATRLGGRPTGGLVIDLVKLGRMDEARRAAQAMEDASRKSYFLPELVALAWATVGEKEKAIDQLERGVSNLSGGISYLLSGYDEFGVLRGNPRFEKILRNANLIEYYR